LTELFGAPTFYDAQTADAALAAVSDGGFAIVDHDAPPRADPNDGVLFVLARAT
jgi:hypothetical protein